jgi:hypothetical protein
LDRRANERIGAERSSMFGERRARTIACPQTTPRYDY